jgi:hypothetical protein
MSPTAWVWLVLILEVGILDGLLALAGQPTLSQWLWRQHRKFRWARWALLGLIVVIALHLVFEMWGKPAPTPPPPTPPDY